MPRTAGACGCLFGRGAKQKRLGSLREVGTPARRASQFVGQGTLLWGEPAGGIIPCYLTPSLNKFERHPMFFLPYFCARMFHLSRPEALHGAQLEQLSRKINRSLTWMELSRVGWGLRQVFSPNLPTGFSRSYAWEAAYRLTTLFPLGRLVLQSSTTAAAVVYSERDHRV